jgi:hypothetical protein
MILTLAGDKDEHQVRYRQTCMTFRPAIETEHYHAQKEEFHHKTLIGSYNSLFLMKIPSYNFLIHHPVTWQGVRGHEM